jgi:hypothetical protein
MSFVVSWLLRRFQGGVVLRIEIRLFPSLYLASCLTPFVSSHLELHTALYLRLCRKLYLSLHLNLNPELFRLSLRTLFLNLFRKSFLRSNPALLDTL